MAQTRFSTSKEEVNGATVRKFLSDIGLNISTTPITMKAHNNELLELEIGVLLTQQQMSAITAKYPNISFVQPPTGSVTIQAFEDGTSNPIAADVKVTINDVVTTGKTPLTVNVPDEYPYTVEIAQADTYDFDRWATTGSRVPTKTGTFSKASGDLSFTAYVKPKAAQGAVVADGAEAQPVEESPADSELV